MKCCIINRLQTLNMLIIRTLLTVYDTRKKLSYSSCKKVRSLISLMSKYAQKMEYHKTNYAELLGIGQNKPVRPHKTISRQKINRLWRIADAPGVDTILILLYTGVRVGELLELEKKNVNMKQRFFLKSQNLRPKPAYALSRFILSSCLL